MPIRVAGKKYYDLRELTSILRLNIFTLRRYVREGRLRAIKIGRNYRVTENALKEFLSCLETKRAPSSLPPENDPILEILGVWEDESMTNEDIDKALYGEVK